MGIETIIVNGTSQIDIHTNDVVSQIIMVLIPVVATLIIGAMTFRFYNKHHLHNVMIDVFKIINDPSHKNAQEKILTAYRESKLYNETGTITDDFIHYADILRRDYDQVGVLIEEKLLPAKQFYLTFGGIAVVTYQILKGDIETKRKNEKRFYFMARFTNLAIDSLNFWYDNGMIDSQPLTDPRTHEPIKQGSFGKKFDNLSTTKSRWHRKYR